MSDNNVEDGVWLKDNSHRYTYVFFTIVICRLVIVGTLTYLVWEKLLPLGQDSISVRYAVMVFNIIYLLLESLGINNHQNKLLKYLNTPPRLKTFKTDDPDNPNIPYKGQI